MRSYSFDLNITPNINRTPSIKQIIQIEDLKWSSIIILFIISNSFIFGLNFNYFSIFLNVYSLITFMLTLYYLFNSTKLNDPVIDSKTFSKNYLRNILFICLGFILGLIELLMILIFYRDSFNSENHFEIYFSYMKLAYSLIRTVFTIMMYLFFKEIITN